CEPARTRAIARSLAAHFIVPEYSLMEAPLLGREPAKSTSAERRCATVLHGEGSSPTFDRSSSAALAPRRSGAAHGSLGRPRADLPCFARPLPELGPPMRRLLDRQALRAGGFVVRPSRAPGHRTAARAVRSSCSREPRGFVPLRPCPSFRSD